MRSRATLASACRMGAATGQRSLCAPAHRRAFASSANTELVPDPSDPADKTKGFMRYKRIDAPYRDAAARAKDWNEIMDGKECYFLVFVGLFLPDLPFAHREIRD
eukprot:SAG31_NODE_2485_length_5624_cov_2.110206_5_plen_105_part_00